MSGNVERASGDTCRLLHAPTLHWNERDGYVSRAAAASGRGGDARADSYLRCCVTSGCAGAMSFEEILDKVKQWPELWLPSHQFYKWKSKQNKAWEQISNELNIEEKVLKTRWKYLKDQYRKELKRIKTNEITKSKWQYFEQLEFLSEELLMERKRKANFEQQEEGEEEPAQKVSVYIEPSSSTPRDPLQEFSNKLNEISDKIDFHTGGGDHVKNDADYMFLMSILPTLRNLSDVQKFVFRGKVNEWLLEALTQNEFSEYERKFSVDS